SWMFVPGDRQRMIDKALRLHVDAVILDLEDGVAPSAKDVARTQISAALDAVAQRDIGRPPTDEGGLHNPARFVRVNAEGDERMTADLEAVVRPGIHGLVLPKVERVEQVAFADGAIADRERHAALTPGSVGMVIAIESARGLLNAPSLAQSSPR